MKTAELIGPALDWAVECAKRGFFVDPDDFVMRTADESYINNWHQGGPIIENLEGFEMKTWLESPAESKCEAHIHSYEGDWIAFGPTPLVAAMRCYVASKLGDEIEIPEELK